MVDVLTIFLLLLIIGSAVAYIVKQKKKGVKCIGCPDSGSCAGHCGGTCNVAEKSDAAFKEQK